jgi:hypothetical protein
MFVVLFVKSIIYDNNNIEYLAIFVLVPSYVNIYLHYNTLAID